MSMYNVIYVDTIVCLSHGLQGLSRCIVGHRLLLTSLSRGNHFHRSIKGAYIWKHSRVRSLLLSPRRLHLGAKNISLPSVLLCHLSGDLLYVYKISSPTIAENNKLFSIIAVSLNASLFDSQLNCHSDKWPITANTTVPSML